MKLACLAVVAAAACAQPVTFHVPMRDGVLLATDVYGADQKLPRPVLLTRTPYDKSAAAKVAAGYVRHGYAVVVQDCRGRYASGGDYTPYNDDRQDGYDTVEWINRQPWSSGRVGMFGSSHVGLVQWLAAAEGAPGLAAIAPAFTASSLYRVAYRDGALRLALISSGGTRANPPPEGRKLPSDIGMLHYHLPLMHLPLARLEEAYGWKLPWMSSLLAHPVFDGFWRQTSAEAEIPGMRLPVQIVTGYFDFFHHDSVQDFFRLRARTPEVPAQLIIGPWTHGSSARRRTQEADFGPDSTIDLQAVNLQWFERFLKGKDIAMPAVRYFVMGENRWREAGSWPPEDTRHTELYLRNDKVASFSPLRNTRGWSSFTTDPANPVPSVPAERRDIDRSALWSPLDYSAIASRPDVLNWTTEPLTEEIRIAGPVRARLFAEADTPSADWVVRLFAQHVDGKELPLAHGIVRVRLTPGLRRMVMADLGSTAVTLPPGSRLRVEISGSSFPMYDRNTHTGEGPFSPKTRVSHQKVFHNLGEPSAILLRVR